jgi:hypothetical protein
MKIFTGFNKTEVLMPLFCSRLFNVIVAQGIEGCYSDLTNHRLKPAIAGALNMLATQLDCGKVTKQNQLIDPNDLKVFVDDLQSLIMPILNGHAKNGHAVLESQKINFLAGFSIVDADDEQNTESLLTEDDTLTDVDSQFLQAVESPGDLREDDKEESELPKEIINEQVVSAEQKPVELSEEQLVAAFEKFVKSLSDAPNIQIQIIKLFRKLGGGPKTTLQSLADFLRQSALRNDFDSGLLFFKINIVSPKKSLQICNWLNQEFKLGLKLPKSLKQSKPGRKKKANKLTDGDDNDAGLMFDFVYDLSDSVKVQSRVANSLKTFAPTPKLLSIWLSALSTFDPNSVFAKKHVISNETSFQICEKLNTDFALGLHLSVADSPLELEESTDVDLITDYISEIDQQIEETEIKTEQSKTTDSIIVEPPVDKQETEEDLIERDELMVFLKSIPEIADKGSKALTHCLSGIKKRLDNAKRDYSINSLRGLIIAKKKQGFISEEILSLKHYIQPEVSKLIVNSILRAKADVVADVKAMIGDLSAGMNNNENKKQQPPESPLAKASDFKPGSIEATLLCVPELKQSTIADIKYCKAGINAILFKNGTGACSIGALIDFVKRKFQQGISKDKILFISPNINETLSSVICNYVLDNNK